MPSEELKNQQVFFIPSTLASELLSYSWFQNSLGTKTIVPMDDTDPVFPLLRVQTNPRDLDSANDPVSRLLPESYPADENHPSGTSPVNRNGLTQTWLATSNSVRPNRDHTHIEWGVGWYTPISIILLLLAGTATALTHHLYYTWLHETTVGDEVRQRWVAWIGSGLSFVTKVTLTASLGISRTQWVWLTLRSKWFTLKGIDALFGVISDPAMFFHWRMVKDAKVATIMAIGMWMFPLAAILTPGTISVHTVLQTKSSPCTVPTLKVKFDNDSTATIPVWTDLGRNLTVREMWNGSHIPEVMRSLIQPMYSGIISHLPDLPPLGSSNLMTVGEVCLANCTYTIKFLGPSIICGQITNWDNTGWPNATVFMKDSFYRTDRFTNGWHGFLVGITHADQTRYPPVFFECRASTTNYTVKQVIEMRRFLEPEIIDVQKPVLSDRYIIDNKIYGDTYTPIIVLRTMLFETLTGSITTGAEPRSRGIYTIIAPEIYDNPSRVGAAIESMAQKMVVSLIAYGVPMYGDGDVLNIAAIQQTDCTTMTNNVFYIYSARTLLVVYGLAVACALATSIGGFIAMTKNCMASNNSVSTIIRTTRNHTLDECIVGADCLGGDFMSSELEKVKLQFGALKANRKGTAAPFAMGVKGEIDPIKRD